MHTHNYFIKYTAGTVAPYICQSGDKYDNAGNDGRGPRPVMKSRLQTIETELETVGKGCDGILVVREAQRLGIEVTMELIDTGEDMSNLDIKIKKRTLNENNGVTFLCKKNNKALRAELFKVRTAEALAAGKPLRIVKKQYKPRKRQKIEVVSTHTLTEMTPAEQSAIINMKLSEH